MQYVDWVDTNNPEAEWESETSCTKYGHKNNVDLFQGNIVYITYIYIYIHMFFFHVIMLDAIENIYG